MYARHRTRIHTYINGRPETERHREREREREGEEYGEREGRSRGLSACRLDVSCTYPARLPNLLDAKGLHHSRGVTGLTSSGDKLLLIRLRSCGRQTGLIEFHASSVFGDVAEG